MCLLGLILRARCSYNKVLAWIDVVLEFVVERLFFLVPDLPDTLGSMAPNLKVSKGRPTRLVQLLCRCRRCAGEAERELRRTAREGCGRIGGAIAPGR